MGYKVDYDKLNSMFDAVNQQNTTWSDQLGDIQTAIARLKDSSNMSGTGADAIRAYMTYVHEVLTANLLQLTELHRSNFVFYKTDYQQNVDTGLDTVIDEDELGQIIDGIDAMKRAAVAVDDNVRDSLFEIRSYFSQSLRSIYGVTDALDQARNVCVNLDEAVKLTEDTHFMNDFSVTEGMITQLTADINMYLTNSREFMATFNPNDPANINTYNRLAEMCNVAALDVAGKAAAVNAAIEYHDAREELAERIEVAKWEKFLVSAVCIVGSAVLLCVLPVSGPLVVAAVSGVSSAIMSANSEVMDQYIVTGDLAQTDWSTVAVKGSKSFVTGFVTGYVGGVAGKTLSGLTGGIPALQSANSFVNVSTHVAIGSTTEIASGILTRGTGEVLDQIFDEEKGVNFDINWEDVGDKALDGKEIIKDGVLGGIGGYIDGHKVDYEKSMYSEYEQGNLKEVRESGEWDEFDSSVDGGTSYSMYSESEQSILNDLHESGEWDALDGADGKYFDPETKTYSKLNYDMSPKTEKDFWDKVSDYTVKTQDKDLSLEELLSPDDYASEKLDTMIGVDEAAKKTYSIFDKAGVVKNNDAVDADKILHDAKENAGEPDSGVLDGFNYTGRTVDHHGTNAAGFVSDFVDDFKDAVAGVADIMEKLGKFGSHTGNNHTDSDVSGVAAAAADIFAK